MLSIFFQYPQFIVLVLILVVLKLLHRSIPTIFSGLICIGLLFWLRNAEFWVFALVCALILVNVLFSGTTFRMDVQGKKCLVTGSSSGLGAEVARELARSGASEIILVARRLEKLQETQHHIQEDCGDKCKVHVFSCDLADPASLRKFAASVRDSVGIPDILVNNAGSGEWKHIEDETLETCVSTIQMPYLASISLTNLFVPYMIKRGSGHVVNITSAAACTALRGAMGYGVSRWAQRAFSDYLRADLADCGIGVTTVIPMEVDGTEYFTTNPTAAVHMPYLFSRDRFWSGLFYITTHDVAKTVVVGIQEGRRHIYAPLAMHFLNAFARPFEQQFEFLAAYGSAVRKPHKRS